MKRRINLSIGSDTLERLDQLAFEKHKNRSQAVTDLVWDAKVQYSQIRGQTNVDELLNPPKKHGKK